MRHADTWRHVRLLAPSLAFHHAVMGVKDVEDLFYWSLLYCILSVIHLNLVLCALCPFKQLRQMTCAVLFE